MADEFLVHLRRGDDRTNVREDRYLLNREQGGGDVVVDDGPRVLVDAFACRQVEEPDCPCREGVLEHVRGTLGECDVQEVRLRPAEGEHRVGLETESSKEVLDVSLNLLKGDTLRRVVRLATVVDDA